MLPRASRLTESKKTVVSDFCDGKAGTVQSTRDDTSRTATSLLQYQVAKRIALPLRHLPKNLIGGDVFPARRSINREPRAQGVRVVFMIATVLSDRLMNLKKDC
jgi:hypothetical protein